MIYSCNCIVWTRTVCSLFKIIKKLFITRRELVNHLNEFSCPFDAVPLFLFKLVRTLSNCSSEFGVFFPRGFQHLKSEPPKTPALLRHWPRLSHPSFADRVQGSTSRCRPTSKTISDGCVSLALGARSSARYAASSPRASPRSSGKTAARRCFVQCRARPRSMGWTFGARPSAR